MKDRIAKLIHVKGLVQGVGFRPFVYRIATKNNIGGWVENGNDGVRIHAEAGKEEMIHFISALSKEAPVAAQVLEVSVQDCEPQYFDAFIIRKSTDYSDEITEISPDIAVCSDCLADMKLQAHRVDYPLINCTNCGPRFSIIKNLPYDRSMTTMAPFDMCPACYTEYTDVLDRRFHAQPVACNDCGPHYQLVNGKDNYYTGTAQITALAAGLISQGKILAIKGTGGFHLACDATNEEAVNRLRQRKNREGKPFAVMFSDLAAIKQYLEVNPAEEETLVSWRIPIVILKNKSGDQYLASGVSNGFKSTGAMLPYMPMHYLLFEKLATTAIVLTSGNLSDEPVMIDNEKALAQLGQIADAFLTYNRDIYNRTDDSVLMFTGLSPRIIRRSRGYAPTPVNLDMNTDGIFAAGAELVNCFCVGKGNKAIMSQHIGDLKNLETLDFYQESIQRHTEMFRIKPSLVVCDLHPDYLSTRFALEYASNNGNLPVVQVQHHHAHIASCMAENNLDEKTIGISMDGVGYGTDGHIWGFEAMICDLIGFERKFHLDYIQQPGGDKANEEPWRMAVSFLNKYLPEDDEWLKLPFLKDIDTEKINVIRKALNNNINSPLTSSAGRLFDAVAAMTGLCNFASFHAEAPMRLEDVIDIRETGMYDFQIGNTINPSDIIRGIVRDLKNHVPVQCISAKFHKTVVQIIIELAITLRKETGLNKVVLSGGTFQNRFILFESEKILTGEGFRVFTQKAFPSNDGGIALGQMVIAAKQRQLNG